MDKLYRVLVIVICSINALHATDRQGAFYRNFWHPLYHAKPLNYCSSDNKSCGMAIATRYCQLMGYAKADQQIIAYHIGSTNYLDRATCCKGWQCKSFKTIRCVSYIPRKPAKNYHYRMRHFVFPRFNHYRIDWCYDGSKGCGRQAANSFCRRMGYLKAKTYFKEKQVSVTQAIANQKMCFGNQCNGFNLIDCYR